MISSLKMALIGLLTVPTLATPATGTQKWYPTADDVLFQGYLRGAAVCLTKEGHDPQEVSANLYTYMRLNGIPFPEPGSKASAELWGLGAKLASRPGWCATFKKTKLIEI